jgi:phosphatidylglycerophosphate synthase
MPFVKEDHSIVNRLTSDLYQQLALAIPDSVNPNAITALGFLPVVSVYLAWLYGCYWPWLTVGAIVFDHIMDGIDGIHARNTNQTTRLGSYLDHFHDFLGIAMVTHLTVETVTSSPIDAHNLTLLTVCGAYLTHYETALSGVMYFPQYISIGEVQLLIALLHAITALFGSDLWDMELFGRALAGLMLPGFYLLSFLYLAVFLWRLPIKFEYNNLPTTARRLLSLAGFATLFGYWTDIGSLGTVNLILAGANMVDELIVQYSFGRKVAYWSLPVIAGCQLAGYPEWSFAWSAAELIYRYVSNLLT